MLHTASAEEAIDENDQLKAQARQDKKTPVIVTLNADNPNNLETGIGYGTDTGVRLRTQYRRAIVNDRGHSFDANLELSEKRQSIDGHLNKGDTLNHQLYETTKTRITSAASDQGYFDSYWRLHDVKVTLPENTADIALKYETGERYQLHDVEFRMSDPNKPFPLRSKILQQLVPFKDGDDYTSWRINLLSSNLINSRYFN
ncbi:hypothetical protein GWI33_011077, partial [Rhynchophorus ferrugineus]